MQVVSYPPTTWCKQILLLYNDFILPLSTSSTVELPEHPHRAGAVTAKYNTTARFLNPTRVLVNVPGTFCANNPYAWRVPKFGAYPINVYHFGRCRFSVEAGETLRV